MAFWAALPAAASVVSSLFGGKSKEKYIQDPAIAALNSSKMALANRLTSASFEMNSARRANLMEGAREDIGEAYGTAGRNLSRRFSGTPGGSGSSLYRNLQTILEKDRASETVGAYRNIREMGARESLATEAQNRSMATSLLGSLQSPTVAYQPKGSRDFTGLAQGLGELVSMLGDGESGGTAGGTTGSPATSYNAWGSLTQGATPRVSTNYGFVNRWGQTAGGY